jgi:hypothetical protein
MNDDELLDEELPGAPPSPWRRIARNTVAVLLVAFFLVTLLVPYGRGAALSAAIAALYALVQVLATRPRVMRESYRQGDDETVH